MRRPTGPGAAARAAMAALCVVMPALLSACSVGVTGGFYGFPGGVNLSAGDCKALAAAVGPQNVWFSQFAGYQPNPWNDSLYHGSGVGCFASYAECRSWLYAVQSDWPQLMDFTFCRKGIRPLA